MADKKVDPVSGNEIPFGAEASEVRDDIPIMASEGEFVIPANVVRFLGLEKIQKMVDKAKEALEAMGEVIDEGNEGDPSDIAEEEDDFPFDPSELVGVDEEEIPEGFAEGGPIGGQWSWPTGSGYKTYKGKDGSVMSIPYVNGQPLFAVPAGYEEVDPNQSAETPEEPQDPMASVATPQGGMQPLASTTSDENTSFNKENRSVFSKDPKDWGVQDFVDFGNKEKNNIGDIAGKAMVSMLPGGKLAMKARESWLNNEVAQMFDDMVTTGVDPQGNKINPKDMANLIESKTAMQQKMSNQMPTGMDLGLGDTLVDSVKKFTGFLSGKPTQSTSDENPKSSLNSAGTKMVNSYSKKGQSYTSTSDDKGGGFGVGSDMGKSSKSGPSTGSISSGGLYAKGGLVTRKKK